MQYYLQVIKLRQSKWLWSIAYICCMKLLLVLLVTVVVLLIVAIGTLIYFLIKRKRNAAIISGIISLLLGILCISLIITLSVKTAKRIQSAFKPKSGTAIYTAIFNKPLPCTQVVHILTPTIPRIDVDLLFHVKLCPEELDRILQQNNYTLERVAVKNLHDHIPLVQTDWFKPQELGDTLMVYHAIIGNGDQFLFCNQLKTELFIRDIHD